VLKETFHTVDNGGLKNITSQLDTLCLNFPAKEKEIQEKMKELISLNKEDSETNQETNAGAIGNSNAKKHQANAALILQEIQQLKKQREDLKNLVKNEMITFQNNIMALSEALLNDSPFDEKTSS